MREDLEFHEGKLVLESNYFCLGHSPESPGCALNGFVGTLAVDKVLGVTAPEERAEKELKALYRNYEGELKDVVVRTHLDTRTGSIRYLVYYEHEEDKPNDDYS